MYHVLFVLRHPFDLLNNKKIGYFQEQEARTRLLREKAKCTKSETDQNYSTPNQECVNLFHDLEEGKDVTTAKNKEHEQELKEEKEKYEKQIGYLTYLGQNTVEATGQVPWYDKIPDRSHADSSNKFTSEVLSKSKLMLDPLNDFKKYTYNKGKECKPKSEYSHISKSKCREKYSNSSDSESKLKGHKRKRNKKYNRKRRKCDSSESSTDEDTATNKVKPSLEQLRAERLKRESAERKKVEALLAKMRGEEINENPISERVSIKQKYNSQFNPEIARQNFNPDTRH